MALLPVLEARARILQRVKVLPAETVPLDKALGRVLAKSLQAMRDQPPFNASAMDGYAVRAADVSAIPAVLQVVGVSTAGKRFAGKMRMGQAVRIFTGAPVPVEADTIVIQENTSVADDEVTILTPTQAHQSIRTRGLDFKKGDALLAEGCVLNARDIGLAAAMNCAHVRVRRKPVVAVLATGDELVLPGQKPRADQIFSSNSHALAALAQSFGAEVINAGIVADHLKATERAIAKLRRADVLLTSGGASVGDHDHVQQALINSGVKIDFWKIAMRPGKPFMYGRKGAQHVMGLPGNPVAALVCARLYLVPLLKALNGLDPAEPTLLARATAVMKANDVRQDYIRGTLEIAEDGTRRVSPYKLQDSSMQRIFREAQCLIVRPPLAPEVAVGDMLPIIALDF